MCCVSDSEESRSDRWMPTCSRLFHERRLAQPIAIASAFRSALLFIDANIAYSCSMRTNEENQQFVAEFKRKLASFYGYDQEFRFVRNTKSEPRATGIKKSLEPRDFLNFAVDDSWHSEKRETASTASETARGQLTAKLID